MIDYESKYIRLKYFIWGIYFEAIKIKDDNQKELIIKILDYIEQELEEGKQKGEKNEEE